MRFLLVRVTDGRRVEFPLPESLTAAQLDELRVVARQRRGWTVAAEGERVKRGKASAARESMYATMSPETLTVAHDGLVDACEALELQRAALEAEIRALRARKALMEAKRQSVASYLADCAEAAAQIFRKRGEEEEG